MDSLFDVLPPTHPAKAPYSLFKQASDTVRSGVIIGLGSRLQVFQSELIKKITTRDEIDLELPGQERCAYFLVTSDQDSTFDFLASLFLSFLLYQAGAVCRQELRGRQAAGSRPYPGGRAHCLREPFRTSPAVSV